MAKKRDQHIVPRCYLKHFVDRSSPIHNKKYEAGVYVNTSALDRAWKMKGLSNNIFTKTRFYNLKSDDPDKPLVEEHLAKLESFYNNGITKLLNGEFSNEILSIFTLFVVTQFLRTEKVLNTHQESWDRVALYADMFEGGDRNRTIYGEISKKQILHLAKPEVLNPIRRKSGVIINCTQIPFLTSDKPVIKEFFNQEDISRIFHPLQQIKYIDDHLESLFYFMPLTPWLAYVSHSSFEGETKGFECSHESVISQLNDMMLLNSSEYIYSFMDNPVTSLPAKIKQEGNLNFLAKIFTNSRRLILTVKNYHLDKSLLTLTSEDVCFSDELFERQKLHSVEVFDTNFSNTIGVVYSKDCTIKTIDKLSGKIIFETKHGL
ncbi:MULTISPECIES: DUF4238 domain-containing protein [unclassified Pseudoalteromonas]|uniref:DUF4238 domain-containing protein n=1 Tax=unclassified Pseudoalteromonas TaxID=194690 RepID=UPI0016042918|nr:MULTISPECIES: DUF4238 domain-containing protein [unclassified Pseudoalteromonas]MBB1333147.1 DUF4238 domain-containing protein [Pseudoalteromonas sp. SR41-6]MBB1458018.1 DUF4238 domain-containing protein [Pseudoalteromonas sp. SG41-8]